MANISRARRFARPTLGRAVIGGGLGGLLGASLFGILLWIISPDLIEEAIPSYYGLSGDPILGWALHLFHGVLIGVVFGILASQRIVFEMITGPVETDILKGLSASVRFGLLGIVYGIAIWTILPFIGLSLLGAVAELGEPGFPGLASEMILGHMLFGLIVGLVYALAVPSRIPPSIQSDP